MKTLQSKYPYYFIFPALIIYFTLFLLPTLMGFFYSFTDWSSYKDEINFVGLKQFKAIFQTPDILKILGNTLLFAFIVMFFQNVIGFFVALLADADFLGKRVVRTIMFLPAVLSYLIVGVTFQGILHPGGPLNQAFSALGLENLRRDWIMDPLINIEVMAAINVWKYIGFSMVIYIAGMQTIPKELYEAAISDGVGWVNKVRYIVIPLIAPSFTVNLVMSLVGSLKVFELIYVTSGGGPGNASEVVNTEVFESFTKGLFAYGSALNLILFVLICLLAFPLLKFMRKREVEF